MSLKILNDDAPEAKSILITLSNANEGASIYVDTCSVHG